MCNFWLSGSVKKALIYCAISKSPRFDIARYISYADSPLGEAFIAFQDPLVLLPGSQFCFFQQDHSAGSSEITFCFSQDHSSGSSSKIGVLLSSCERAPSNTANCARSFSSRILSLTAGSYRFRRQPFGDCSLSRSAGQARTRHILQQFLVSADLLLTSIEVHVL